MEELYGFSRHPRTFVRSTLRGGKGVEAMMSSMSGNAQIENMIWPGVPWAPLRFSLEKKRHEPQGVKRNEKEGMQKSENACCPKCTRKKPTELLLIKYYTIDYTT